MEAIRALLQAIKDAVTGFRPSPVANRSAHGDPDFDAPALAAGRRRLAGKGVQMVVWVLILVVIAGVAVVRCGGGDGGGRVASKTTTTTAASEQGDEGSPGESDGAEPEPSIRELSADSPEDYVESQAFVGVALFKPAAVTGGPNGDVFIAEGGDKLQASDETDGSYIRTVPKSGGTPGYLGGSGEERHKFDRTITHLFGDEAGLLLATTAKNCDDCRFIEPVDLSKGRPDYGDTSTIKTNAALTGIARLTPRSAPLVLLTTETSSTVARVADSGGFLQTADLIPLADNLARSEGMTATPRGVVIAESGAGRLALLDLDSRLSRLSLSGCTLSRPTSPAYDARSGTVYVVDTDHIVGVNLRTSRCWNVNRSGTFGSVTVSLAVDGDGSVLAIEGTRTDLRIWRPKS